MEETVLLTIFLTILFILGGLVIISIVLLLIPHRFDLSLQHDQEGGRTLAIRGIRGLVQLYEEKRGNQKTFTLRILGIPIRRRSGVVHERAKGKRRGSRFFTIRKDPEKRTEERRGASTLKKIATGWPKYLSSERMDQAFDLVQPVWHMVRGAFRIITIQQANVELRMGLSDPAVTGIAAGWLNAAAGALYGMGIPVAVQTVPDFESEGLRANLEATSRVCLWRALSPALRLAWRPLIRRYLLGRIFGKFRKRRE
jgi:hypothetical protein